MEPPVVNRQDDLDQPSLVLSYLQLLRLPNIFTAMADVGMGFLFIDAPWAWDDTGALRPIGLWVVGLLVAASSFLYAAGVVLNDVFDAQRDEDEQPDRPIPSGRISLRMARWLGWELLLLGAVLPGGVAMILHESKLADPFRPVLVGGLLAGTIVLYNAVLKQTVLGPLTMGACRMLNVLLGMSLVAGPLAPEHWLVAGGIGVYIAGVTWFAREDSQRSDRRQLFGAMLVMLAGVGMLAWLPRWTNNLIWMLQQDPSSWYMLIGLLGAISAARCLWAIGEPSPGRVHVAVAQAIFSLIVLDAAVAYSARGPQWGVTIVALLLPAVFLGRWIKGT